MTLGGTRSENAGGAGVETDTADSREIEEVVWGAWQQRCLSEQGGMSRVVRQDSLPTRVATYPTRRLPLGEVLRGREGRARRDT